MKILIIDDEKMIVDLAARILEKDNHNVIPAYSGKDAIQIFQNQKDTIDLVIIDHIMPGLSGLETVQALRKMAPDIPCIYSSGNMKLSDEFPDSLKDKIYFLEKPYRATSLTQLVNKVQSDLEI